MAITRVPVLFAPAALALLFVAFAPATALAEAPPHPRASLQAPGPRRAKPNTKASPGAKASPGGASREKSPVTWGAVTAPKGDDKARLEKSLRSMLEREASQADWGRAARAGLEGSFTLRHLYGSLDRGVLRVHCAASGRLRDGRPASSTFTLGGRPEERTSLERRALTLAVRGVVVRLAELARASAKPNVRVSSEPGEF